MLVGWIAWGEDGKPYRPSRSGYAWEVGLTNPPRLYKTRKMAERQSPIGVAKPAYIEETEGGE